MSRRLSLVVIVVVIACVLLPASRALAAEVQIGGRVLLPGGAPLPKAEVTLVPLTDLLNSARQALDGQAAEPAARALTDDQGRFALSAPSAGLWTVRIAAPGFVVLETALEPLIEPTELPDAELEPDAGLNLRVVGPDGKPVTGAWVQVVTDRSRMRFGLPAWSIPTRRGTTDAAGALRLERGERERVRVDVYAPGLGWLERRGVYGTAVAVKLQGGSTRVIEVHSKQGQPLAGVVVSLGQTPLAVTRTGDDGRVSLTLEQGKETPVSLLARDGRRLDARLGPRKAEPEKPERLVLPDNTAVSGRLIDARSRRPVSGGLVWDAENPLLSSVADDQGAFALAGPSGSRLRITAGAPGYLNANPREFQLADDGRPGPTLVLDPAAAIEGKVTDADGQPVAGAEIELRVKRTPGRMRIELGRGNAAPRAISTARGRFRLSPVNPDASYTVHAQAEGFAPVEDNVGQLESYKTRTDVHLELTPGQSIRGIVVDEDGHGLGDVALTLAPASAGGGAGMMRIVNAGDLSTKFEGSSGADGRFEVRGLPAGKFDLEAARRGFARTKVSAVEVAAEPVDLGEVLLAPGESVQGIVLDGDGQPIEGVEVFVKELGPMAMVMMGPMGGGGDRVEPDAMTDPAGWFQVSDLGTRSAYDLSFRRTGYVDGNQNGIQAPRAEPLQVTLDAASKVAGKVLDAEGEPIAAARVTLTRSKTMEMGGAAMQMIMTASETTDAAGGFVFEDQEPGTISLSAVATGSQEAKLQDLLIPKGEDLVGIEIPLRAGAIVEGRVLAPDGRAAIGATVNPVDESARDLARFGGAAPTDGEGYFRVEGLAPGKASIEARHADYPRAVRDIELKEGINGLTLHFEGGQEVSGRVSDEAGSPVSGAGVRLATAGRYFGGPETTSGADGTFKLPGVQDGDYLLFADAEGFAGSGRDRQVKVAGEPVLGLEVRLGRGGTIAGRVSGVDPETFARVSVRAEGPGFRGLEGARVDHQGNYRVEHLEPGDYTVVASVSNSGRQARQQVVLEPGTPEVRVDLQFGGGLTLSGRAAQGEEPVAGAMIYASGIDIDHDGWSQTDQQGRFSIEGLEAGRYTVRLQHWQTGLSYSEEIEFGTSREIELKVPTAAVSGRIVDASDSEPLAGVTVVLEPLAGETPGFRPPRSGTTDLQGKFILDNVGDGNWRVRASKQGYAAQSVTVNVQFQKGPDDLRLTLNATEGLTLEARLPSGGIPGELRVAVLDGSGAALTSGTYATGENGRVRLSSVPPGSWELLVSGAGSAVSNLMAEAPGATIPVALQPACTLRVRVPELIASGAIASVRLTDSSGRPFRSLGWSGAPQGEWRMTGGTLEFGSLPPGGWTVSVTAGEGQAWQASATTTPAGPSEVIIDR